jgi:hypothetical protein
VRAPGATLRGRDAWKRGSLADVASGSPITPLPLFPHSDLSFATDANATFADCATRRRTASSLTHLEGGGEGGEHFKEKSLVVSLAASDAGLGRAGPTICAATAAVDGYLGARGV